MEIVRVIDLPKNEQWQARNAMARKRIKKYVNREGRVCIDREELVKYKENAGKGGKPVKGGIFIDV